MTIAIETSITLIRKMNRTTLFMKMIPAAAKSGWTPVFERQQKQRASSRTGTIVHTVFKIDFCMMIFLNINITGKGSSLFRGKKNRSAGIVRVFGKNTTPKGVEIFPETEGLTLTISSKQGDIFAHRKGDFLSPPYSSYIL